MTNFLSHCMNIYNIPTYKQVQLAEETQTFIQNNPFPKTPARGESWSLVYRLDVRCRRYIADTSRSSADARVDVGGVVYLRCFTCSRFQSDAACLDYNLFRGLGITYP
jgi:hypothetical protein